MQFFSKIASGGNRCFESAQKMKNQGRRDVALKASVHPEMSAAKMMRLKKIDLLSACEKCGLGQSGTKHELVASLRKHFSSTATIANTDAALVSEAKAGMDLVQHLTDKVSQLDEAIQMKTDELQSMHEGDRALTEVVSELADLKVSWERKLKEVSAGLEEVVALKQAQTEFSKLQQQQVELREELEVLSRMLKLRETETQTLQAQLDQVRQDQSSDKASMQTERLAVLALASHVASGQTVQNTRSELTARNSWTSPALGSTGSPASAVSIEKMLSASPNLVNITQVTKSTDGKHVFGAALPGLLAINATSEVLRKYSAVRDSVFKTGLQARVSDAACAGILCFFASAMF